MSDLIEDIASVREKLLDRIKAGESSQAVLRSSELKDLFVRLKDLPNEQRADLGRKLNDLRQEILDATNAGGSDEDLSPIDVTAPFDANLTPSQLTDKLLPAQFGSVHPLMREMEELLDICYRLGFKAIQTPELDDDFHMFGSLNFPEGHPARDDFDTLVTTQKDKSGKPYVAPAHTSTMQIRVLEAEREQLKAGRPIAYVIPGRVFRSDDLDARHEHTFYQLEGLYVGKAVTVANLMATLTELMSAYYGKAVELKTQPFYFPFTEPSFEFSISCPYCDKKGCNICSYSGWIELLGCGMTHPNVYLKADINPEEYTGFAWGIGFMRMAMIKYGIEDIRYFQSGRLDFLRQFS